MKSKGMEKSIHFKGDADTFKYKFEKIDLNNRLSWDKLQDCIDHAQYIGKFANDRLDVPDILDLLRSYETLYPYKVFASSEYVITRSHCSLMWKVYAKFGMPPF